MRFVVVACVLMRCAEGAPAGETAAAVVATTSEPNAVYVAPADWPSDCAAPSNVEAEPAYRRVCDMHAEERRRQALVAAQQSDGATKFDWLPFAREYCFPSSCPPGRVGGHCDTPEHHPITDVPNDILVQVLTEKCLAAAK